MDNLITEASSWLQDPVCKKGSIQERTKAVLLKFKDYINRNKVEVERDTGVSTKVIYEEIKKCQDSFAAIINAYLNGVHYIAIASAKTFIAEMNPITLLKGEILYKARESHSNYLYEQHELFHIPYDKRDKIGNQRFSISGMPCLYLATSSYACWEELGRVEFGSCNFCGFSNQKDVPVYDLSLPPKVSTFADIKRICTILACSLSAKRDALFKEEYILPQCFLQALILRHHYYHLDKKTFAVRYLSVHALNGDADCFEMDLNNKTWVDRLVNYVFPAASNKTNGFNQLLRDLFFQTDAITMFKETLLHPDRLMKGASNDVYLDSQFGLMDAFLDKKMGYDPRRQETDFVKMTTI